MQLLKEKSQLERRKYLNWYLFKIIYSPLYNNPTFSSCREVLHGKIFAASWTVWLQMQILRAQVLYNGETRPLGCFCLVKSMKKVFLFSRFHNGEPLILFNHNALCKLANAIRYFVCQLPSQKAKCLCNHQLWRKPRYFAKSCLFSPFTPYRATSTLPPAKVLS